MKTSRSDPCLYPLPNPLGRVPCMMVRPCPLHDREPIRLSDDERDYIQREWQSWEQRCKAGPAPRLMEEEAHE